MSISTRADVEALLAIHQAHQTLATNKAQRQEEAQHELEWLVKRCQYVSNLTLKSAERLCDELLKDSGIDCTIRATSSTYDRPANLRRFGVGDLYIYWYIDSISHILFVTIYEGKA